MATTTQTSNLLELQNTSDAVMTSFDKNGQLAINSQAVTDQPLTIKAAASQTESLTEWQDSAGTPVLTVGSAGAVTATVNPTITNAAPGIVLTDTTASAKSLTVAVDANVANIRESAGASGSLLALDLANNRVGIGTASPSVPLQVSGNALFSSALQVTGATTLNGSVGGTGVKDEDNMISDSATAVPTQQSVKAYVDNYIKGVIINAGEVITNGGELVWRV